MRWIARFFLIVALAFLALDILDSGAPAPSTGVAGGDTAADSAADGAATGNGTADAPAAGETPAPATPAPVTPAPAAKGPSPVILKSLGERWFEYHPDSYQQVSPAVSRHVSPWLDDNIVQPLMLQPAFLIFFFLSLLFSFFSWLIGRARDDDW